MTLPTGSRLGPYEVVSALAAGGMGEVYRAKDPRLHRELAIKVLPASVAGDTEFLNRFQSEARAASALNHPNIVTIHDIGSADGISYIAMELIEGKTVRELLDGGPPPLKKSLQIAAQAADGLAAAHARGIVHRDLKPENLMVSKDGVVKILDFGLAKTTPLYAKAGEATGSYQPAATQPGSVLGTVGYMSPEQASGRSLDYRSDQFTLGTILYEMVTGKRAWKRNSAAETLTAIIREDPQPSIATAAPSTPMALRWIIDRCLAKEPEERYASTRDLARDLATVRDHLSEIRGESPVGSTARPRRRRAAWFGVLGALAVGAALLLGSRLRGGEEPLPNWVQVGFRRGTVWSGRFAPDGQTIVYSAAWDGDPTRIYSTRPGSTETRTLDLPPGRLEAISANSEIAFLRSPRFYTFSRQQGILVRAGLEGGVGRDVLEDVQAADWSPDGTQLAVAREVDGKVRLEYPIGKTLLETKSSINSLRVSPDGAWIAFMEHGVKVVAVRVSDGERRVLSEGWFSGAGVAWSPDGREIWFTPQKQVRDSSPALMAVTLSGKQREVVRAPGQLRLYDIAPDGRLLLARSDLQIGLRAVSPATGRESELAATDDSWLSDLSSDGRRVLFGDRNALILRATDGSPPLRLGDGYDQYTPRLSPDGNWVLTTSWDGLDQPLLVPVGAGDERRIESHKCDGVEWFPDGARFLCTRRDPAGRFSLAVLEVASGKATEIPIPESAADFSGSWVSPDGAFIAGMGAGPTILILPVAGGEPRRIDAAGFPRAWHRSNDPDPALDAKPPRAVVPIGWASDGRHLFLHRLGDVPDRVMKLDLATATVEPWKDLTLEDLAGVVRIHPVRVAPDGRSWAYTYTRVLSNLYVVDGLK